MKKKDQTEPTNVSRTLRRVLKWMLLTLLVTSLLSFAAMQIPRVQTEITNQLTSFFTINTSFKLSIDKVNLTWYDQMIFEGVRLAHQKTDTALLEIKKMRLDFNLIGYLLRRQLIGEELILDDLHLNLKRDSASSYLNLSLFMNELKAKFVQDSTAKKTSIKVDKILLENGRVSYLVGDNLEKTLSEKLLQLSQMDLEIRDFGFDGKNTDFLIKRLNAVDSSMLFDIHHMSGKVYLGQEKLSFEELDLKVGKSSIGNSIVIRYNDFDDFKSPFDSLYFDLSLKNTQLDSSDLRLLSPRLPLFHPIYAINGEINGPLRSPDLSSTVLEFGDSTLIKIDGSISGLPSPSNVDMNLTLTDSRIHPQDIKEYLPPNSFTQVSRLGILKISGSIKRQQKHFDANCDIKTQLGIIKPDIKFYYDSLKPLEYSGFFSLQNFALSRALPSLTSLKNVSLTSQISGQGLDKNVAEFKFETQIQSATITDGSVNNAFVSGSYTKGILDVRYDIKDPNLSSSGELKADLIAEQKNVELKAQLASANLKEIGISNKDLRFNTDVILNLKGTELDKLTGNIQLSQFQFDYEQKSLHLDSLEIASRLQGEKRLITLKTDGLSAKVSGEFLTEELLKQLQALHDEMVLKAQNETIDINQYYLEKQQTAIRPLSAAIDLTVQNPNKFLTPFFPELTIEGFSQLAAQLKSDSLMSFTLHTNIDTIRFRKITFLNNSIDIDINKDIYSNDLLGAIYLSSNSQKWMEKVETSHVGLELIWENDQVDFWARLNQEQLLNKIDLNGKLSFLDDRTEIHITPSETILFGKNWHWLTQNKINIKGSKVSFHDFTCFHDEQKISLSGTFGEKESTGIQLAISSFDLEQLRPFTKLSPSGTLAGHIKLSNSKSLISNLNINRLKLANLVIGDINCHSYSDKLSDEIQLQFDLLNEHKVTAKGLGTYNFEQQALREFKLNFNRFNITPFQTVLANRFSQLNGYFTGVLDIQGDLFYPSLLGDGIFEQGFVHVDYLKTDYSFSGPIQFHDHDIFVNQVSIKDQNQNKATLDGRIRHLGRKNIEFYLDGQFKDFLVLNTTSLDNKLYYGTAFGTGEIEFRGDLNNFIVNARASTEKGTRMSVPIGNTSNSAINNKDYIAFKDLTQNAQNKKMDKEEAQSTEQLQGIVLNLDLEMTNDAYLEMIFDIKSGDIIRGRGAGNLKLKVNTEGDFDMFGDYAIEEGGYNFTLYNIINKEFEIESGSSISWLGDPYGALLKIDANYTQLVSISPLITDIDEEDLNTVEVRKKYPATVDLELTGDLLTPDIGFDINVNDYPRNINISSGSGNSYDLERYVNAFRTRISSNEQEMNRQVFSLIVLRKLSPEDGFQVNRETIGSSFSEFISNQLSYWANQVDENLEIDVDLSSLDQEAFNTFQLRLSYTFLDGRLRVTRGGGLPNDQNRDDIYSVIGDWSVEYLLTEDGRFRAKLYSRSDLDAIESQLGEGALEAGISLQYVKSFNELSQILKDNRARNLLENSSNSSPN